MERLEVEVEGVSREMCHELANAAAHRYFGDSTYDVVPPIIVEPGERQVGGLIITFRARFTFRLVAKA